MTVQLHTVAERPDLRERRSEIGEAWPEFMHHDPVSDERWGRLYSEFPECQFFALDTDEDRLVGEGNCLPVPWDSRALPLDGWRRALIDGFDRQPEVAVSAIAVTIAADRRGSGLSRPLLARMREIAARRGATELVAPVRPSLKSSYPLTPIERYVEWTRTDGLPFDPWLRTHARAGASIVSVAPRSMEIPGTVAEWTEWVGMAFPESGAYVVPGALVPVEIDVERDRGVYVEPNVWMRHPLDTAE
jgi:GNAT superfamily N-acetyltransferase